jgi:non-ribosomal peptide synthetase component F
VVVGTPVNVRDPASANAIGYHANLLPLRVRLDDDADFAAVVKRTRNAFLEAIGHANVPLEQVSPEVIAAAPGSWRSSFFRHLFNYLPGSVAAELSVAGRPARPVLAENGFSRFDLEFFFTSGATTTIRAAFCTDAFDADDVALLLARYDELLAGIGDRLDVPVARLSAQCAADRAVTAAPEPVAAPDSVVAAVAERVRADAGAVAIIEPDRTVRYGELWSRRSRSASWSASGPRWHWPRRGARTWRQGCSAAGWPVPGASCSIRHNRCGTPRTRSPSPAPAWCSPVVG